MRLLFVIDSLSTGGAQRQIVNLALGFHQRGHSVEIFRYAPGDLLATPLYTAGIPIHTYLKRSRYSLDVIGALREQIQVGAYDIVLSYLPTPNFYAIIARKLSQRKPRLVVSERFFDPPGEVDLLKAFTRRAYRFSDYIVVNSHHQRVNLSHKYQWMEGVITTIYNGLDTSTFHPSKQEPPIDMFKLLVVSRVSPEKNGLCLIQALSIIRSKYNLRPHVSWVGQHIKSIKNCCQYLQQMECEIAARGLADQWSWLHQRSDIVQLLHQHNALVHPSYGEGLPNAVCEALACGRPVIVSNTLDHPYLVEHGVSGYLFDWKDPDNLAETIKNLHDLPMQERQAMGQRGRQFAEQKLSLCRLTDEYEQLFRSLIK